MVKTKNIIAGLGVVAGLGMAMLPLGAFATTDLDDTESHTIRATIADTINLTVETNKGETITTADGDKTISKVALNAGELNASLIHTLTVDSNVRGGYDLKMSSTNNALRLITAYDNTYEDVASEYSDTYKINSITEANALTGDSYGWGFKIKESTAEYGANYNPIPTTETSIFDATRDGETGEGHTGAYRTGSYSDKYNVQYGIRPAADQVAGAYEATVTYRAVANVL